MPDFVTIGELLTLAEETIPSPYIDRVLAGAGRGQTIERNRRALDKIAIQQRVLTAIDSIDMSTEFFRTQLPTPIIVAPQGSLAQLHPEGDLAMAKGAGRDGTLSTARPNKWTIKEVADAATGPLLHIISGRHPTDEDLEAIAAIESCPQYKGIAITCDGQVSVRMDRYLETRFSGDARSQPNRRTSEKRFTWADIDALRDVATLPLGMKSIMHPDDARMAIDHGMDFVWVSNHGGRQLDSARATIDVLPEIVEAVDGRIPVYMDGGIRYGSDVFKALAYGASLVAIGKLGSCALGVNGADGIARLLEILQEELMIAMTLSAHTTISQIAPGAVTKIDY